MSTEQNKALVRRVVEELFNRGNMRVADDAYASDYVQHNPIGIPVRGAMGVKHIARAYRTAIPDLHVTIASQIAEGDKVASHWIAGGTQQGELFTVPPKGGKGRRVMISGTTITHMVGGRIVEDWNYWDTASLMRQLGAATLRGKLAA